MNRDASRDNPDEAKPAQALAQPLERALAALAEQDAAIAAALALVGPPPPRTKPLTFENLWRVIVGQQLSVKAAATIAARLQALPGGVAEPRAVLEQPHDALRGAGLSNQKARYLHALAEAVASGDVALARLPQLDDEAAVARLTAVKGFGRWSAEMVLIFLLDRPDVWPVGDLGVRVGVGRILGLPERPVAAEVEDLGERWRPYRSAVAQLAWHYNHNAPR